jgi:hypothetical protein
MDSAQQTPPLTASGRQRTAYARCRGLWDVIKRSPCVALYVNELCLSTHSSESFLPYEYSVDISE